jgi:copper chaperone CopZ
MNTQKRTYTLGGVFDERAKSKIEYTLNEMKTISDVQVDLNSKQVSFQFVPEQIQEEFIKNTINTLGYSVLQD